MDINENTAKVIIGSQDCIPAEQTQIVPIMPLIPGYLEMAFSCMMTYADSVLGFLGYVYGTSKKGKQHPHIKFAPDANYILTISETTSRHHITDEDDKDDIRTKTSDENDLKLAFSMHNPRIDFTYDGIPLYITIHIYEKHLGFSYGSIFKYYTIKIGYPADFDITLLLSAADQHAKTIYKSDKKLRIFNNNGYEWIPSCSIDFRSIDNIYLPRKDLELLFDKIERFINPKTKQLYKLLGMKRKLTILLAGVPGSGKTSLISAIASKYKYNLCNLTYQKTTDADLRGLGAEVPANSIVSLEDLDCVIYERKQHDENHITFAGLLKFLDGMDIRDGTIIFITTNHKDKFDPALLRPGRVDFVMTFNNATGEQIGDMFTRYMSVDLESMEIHTDPAILETIAEARKKFVSKVTKLCIPITTSIVQQYLINYIGKIDECISNIEKIKEMYHALPSDDPSKLYS